MEYLIIEEYKNKDESLVSRQVVNIDSVKEYFLKMHELLREEGINNDQERLYIMDDVVDDTSERLYSEDTFKTFELLKEYPILKPEPREVVITVETINKIKSICEDSIDTQPAQDAFVYIKETKTIRLFNYKTGNTRWETIAASAFVEAGLFDFRIEDFINGVETDDELRDRYMNIIHGKIDSIVPGSRDIRKLCTDLRSYEHDVAIPKAQNCEELLVKIGEVSVEIYNKLSSVCKLTEYHDHVLFKRREDDVLRILNIAYNHMNNYEMDERYDYRVFKKRLYEIL